MSDEILNEHLNLLEQKIGENKIAVFSASGEVWTGDIEDKNLFLLWKSLKEELFPKESANVQVIQVGDQVVMTEDETTRIAEQSQDRDNNGSPIPGPSNTANNLNEHTPDSPMTGPSKR